jgi:hypothetical protein
MKLANLSARARRNLVIAGRAFVLFTITGFFILPPIVKSQLEKRASAALGRTVTVGRVRLNPYTLSITLENLEVREQDGKGPFLGWTRLYVNFDALASLTGDWVLSEIELDGFNAAVAVNHDGSLNFSDILARLTTPPTGRAATPAKPSRPIRIGSFKVAGARVDFADQSRRKPFATIVGPLTFALTEFRTAGARGAPYHFEAVTESGEKLAWTGTISAELFRSVGELNLENIFLPKYSPYYADRMQADPVAGKLSVRGHYEINLTEGQRVLKLTDGALQLRGLKLLERGSQETAVELPALDISGVNADALTQKAVIGSINFTGGHLRVRREKDGSVNLLTMLQPAAENPAPTPPGAVSAAPAKLPDVTIGEVVLKDFQVDLTDLAAPRPAQLGLGGIQLSLKNVTLADGATMPLQLSLNWAPKGTVHVEGALSIKPEVKADLKVDVAVLEILPLSPYLEQFVNARLTQGTVTANLKTQVALPDGQPFAAKVAGEVKVEKFGLVDGVHNEDLGGFGSLVLNGLRVSTSPQLSVALDEVNIAAPYARVVMNSDKSLNLAAIARAEAKPPAPATAPTPTTPAPKVEVGKVIINEGDFSFADHSVEPNVRTAITQFGGTIAGLSSENMAKAAVDLKATVDGAGPVAITGQLDPFGVTRHVDLKLDFRNVDLMPFSPYTAKYAGYELARGKLALDVKFVLDGRKIDSADQITLQQFTFGAPVQSPDDIGMPVRLGVALLKDIDGKIFIDVPVQGSIDDPDFQIGKVVWRVIFKLLTKAAVSPFALLGSMFGGGGDELAYQDFASGAAVLQPEGIKKLETMVKALTNRPGLSLDLEGSYDGPADTFALKQQKLADTVRRAIWEARHASDPTIAPPEQLVITPEENAAMMKKLFDEKFPPGTQFGAPLAKAPVAAAPPPAPKKGFIGRVVDAVTFKGLRGDKAMPTETAKPVETVPAVAAVAAGPTLDEMTGRLAETMEVGENDLRALAQSRAQQVRDYFINAGKIDPERLFLAKDKSDSAKPGRGPRVFLTLQ